jgi:hypothetical protein
MVLTLQFVLYYLNDKESMQPIPPSKSIISVEV